MSKMKKKYYSLILKIKYLISGIRTRKKLHLIDKVKYKDGKYIVTNMVTYCGQCGTWLIDIVEDIPLDGNGKRKNLQVPIHELKKMRTWKNFKRGILNTYDFNMRYWHEINIRKRMEGEHE